MKQRFDHGIPALVRTVVTGVNGRQQTVEVHIELTNEGGDDFSTLLIKNCNGDVLFSHYGLSSSTVLTHYRVGINERIILGLNCEMGPNSYLN